MRKRAELKMTSETLRWSERYQAALRRHLKQDPSAAPLRSALLLGRQAVALGLETLDVALIHEQALKTFAPPAVETGGKGSLLKRAKGFFAEALVPIEMTHRASVNTSIRLSQLSRTLSQRTADATKSAQRLRQAIAQRQAAEVALKKSAKARAQRLQKSGVLEKRLRDRTREILSAQEKERQTTSRHLQNEIAQTLIAINLGLLALRTSANATSKRLEKEIAITERLVRKSLVTVNRFSL